MVNFGLPFNLIDECDTLNRSTIGHRVRNKVIFSNDDFIVMAVIGPNNRTDFHLNSKQVIHNTLSNLKYDPLGIFLSNKRKIGIESFRRI